MGQWRALDVELHEGSGGVGLDPPARSRGGGGVGTSQWQVLPVVYSTGKVLTTNI